jgi:predicted transcriptional regulator
MIKALADAIEKARALPPERQSEIAEVLEDMVRGAGDIYVLSPEEERLLDEGIADLDAGRVATDAEMEAFWRRHEK